MSFQTGVNKWYSLDRSSAWAEWADGAIEHAEAVKRFDPHVIIGTDWTASGVYRSLLAAKAIRPSTPYLYSCLRVFTINPSNFEDDTSFYRAAEADACGIAMQSGGGGAIAVLSSGDKIEMEKLIAQAQNRTALNPQTATAATAAVVVTAPVPALPRIAILHPPLRRDIELIASASASAESKSPVAGGGGGGGGDAISISTGNERVYVTCCCRLSPEKNVSLFIDLCIALKDSVFAAPLPVPPESDAVDAKSDLADSPKKQKRRSRLIPFVCGAGGADLKQKLRAAFGANCEVHDFLTPDQLADVFRRSVLNVHPATYEAYGMTIVEAAAFGVPSLLHHRVIGAADRLTDGKE